MIQLGAFIVLAVGAVGVICLIILASNSEGGE